MKVITRHGFIAFYPNDEHEIQVFKRIFQVALVAEKDYWTFDGLIGLPRYSIAGAVYGGLPAIATYEGRDASEVMEQNQFVYSLVTKTLVPLLSIVTTVSLPQSLDYLLATGPMIQPGAILSNGKRVVSFQGEIDLDVQRLYIYGMELYP